VGTGRAALVRRVTARGGNEQRRAAEAARRGLRRGPSGRLLQRVARVELPTPVRSAFAEVVRHSRVVQQKFLQRQKLRTIGIGLAVIWAVWTFVLGDAGIPRLLWVQWQNGRLAHEIERLEVENARLNEEVRHLRSGAEGIVEELAREEHAMVRDGEVLVRFYEGKAPRAAKEVPKAKEPEGRGD
jgi:cell division protein FtsB